MDWFHLIFPLVMILTPLLFVILSGTSPQSLPNARPLMLALWACTLGTAGVHVALWSGGIKATTFMSLAFMPLWFALAMPALMHRRPEWQRLHGSTPERTASLQPRTHEPLLPRWLVLAPACISLAGLVSVGIAFATRRARTGAFGQVDDGAFIAALLLVVGSGVQMLGMIPAITRAARMLPEPAPAGGHAALQEAYAEHRRFVACSTTLLFGVGLNTLAVALASSVAWVPAADPLRSTLLIAGGAGGGTLIGLVGATVGTMASLRRARIAAQFREIAQSRSTLTH